MVTSKINYKFKNGVTAYFTIRQHKTDPIAKVEWSCELTRNNFSQIYNEYISKCVPTVYQQIADFTGESILWVDASTGQTKHFKPSEVTKN